MASKLHSVSRTRRDTASVETISVTTHVVHVDLAHLLRGYDVMDNVVLMVATPSGRDKRIAIGGNFLVEPHHADESYLA
jgi:hypothetical protein